MFAPSGVSTHMSLMFGSVYWKVWHVLLDLSADPDYQVADMVRSLTEQIIMKVRFDPRQTVQP